jgi:flagellar biosynthesis protein FlhF
MMHRTKVVAEDSREAMAKIAKELGDDAVILSTRKVAGGIEIIAGHRGSGMADEETAAPLGEAPPVRSEPKREHFARLLAESARTPRPAPVPNVAPRFAAPSVGPAKATPLPPEAPKSAAAAPKAATARTAEIDADRFSRLESSVKEIKSMLSSEIMLGGLKSLIPTFLAQAGSMAAEDSDRRFAEFLARRMLHKRPPLLTSGPQIVVTLGPSGSGKTTLLAQLAARLRMRLPEEKIAFVNADMNRLGAAEQLRAHGRILDVPVIDIEQATQLSNLAENAGRGLSMFIDMPSNPEECTELLGILNARADDLAPMVRCGVMAANLSAESIDATLDRYPNMDALALTKLDEARLTISALSRLGARGPGIAWIARNAHLVRGLSEPDRTMLEELIFTALPGAVSQRLN